MNCGSKFNAIHMATLEKTKPPPRPDATTGSNNPFPTKVAMTLNTTVGKPRLTKPSRNPLVLGTILHGPVFINLAMPKPPLKIERASVMRTDPEMISLMGLSSPFDISRQIRMCICGIDSKKGSEKNLEYFS